MRRILRRPPTKRTTIPIDRRTPSGRLLPW